VPNDKIPDSKRCKIRNLCLRALSNLTHTIREFSELQGVLISACPAVPYGLLYTRDLASCITKALLCNNDYESLMTLNKTVIEDLSWWISCIAECRVKICGDNFSKIIFTDASLSGWGCKSENDSC
jgi:hypothetical protein